MEVVYNSSKDMEKNSQIAATNAITILNVSKYSFLKKNLNNIRIKGAELAGGNFTLANFTNADLTGVNLRSSILTKAIFKNTNMENIELGILPGIKFDT